MEDKQKSIFTGRLTKLFIIEVNIVKIKSMDCVVDNLSHSKAREWSADSPGRVQYLLTVASSSLCPSGVAALTKQNKIKIKWDFAKITLMFWKYLNIKSKRRNY